MVTKECDVPDKSVRHSSLYFYDVPLFIHWGRDSEGVQDQSDVDEQSVLREVSPWADSRGIKIASEAVLYGNEGVQRSTFFQSRRRMTLDPVHW